MSNTANLRSADIAPPSGFVATPDRGLAGSPAAEIGRVLFATSTLTSAGLSTIAGDGPTSMGKRVTLAACLGICFFPIGFVLGMLTANNGSVAGALGLVTGAFGFWILYRGLGKTRQEGRCVYVGTNGATQSLFSKGNVTTKSIVYSLDQIVLSSASLTIYDGGSSHDYFFESIHFLDGASRPLLGLAGAFGKNETISEEVVACRAIMECAGKLRSQATKQLLSTGRSLPCPVFQGDQGFTTNTVGSITIGPNGVEVQQSSGSSLYSLEDLKISTVKGQLQLSSRKNGQLLAQFRRDRVGNSDILLTMFGHQ
jgi:hypothetical protein